jgi:phosphopantothenoylcysteine decarboxylase/phosphopantothenate--cysteine ligase
VTPLTFEAVSGRPVAHDLFGAQSVGPGGGEAHISLSDWPDVIVCAPATANFCAKLAHGLADEMLSTTVLAANAPLVLAPAMHARMWTQPATQENIALLKERGAVIAGPTEGRLASGEVGIGRLADSDEILHAVAAAIPGAGDLRGLKIVVSAGGTREAIDPVRFLSNRSSGLMGHAIAAAAEWRGAAALARRSQSRQGRPALLPRA